jgi:hypothetical protein
MASSVILSQFDAALACSTKEKSYVVEMWSDLRSLATAEAAFHETYGHYAVTLDSLSYETSTGVNRPTIEKVGETGWRARNTHSQLAYFCTIAIGEAVQPGEVAGEPKCAALNPPSRISSALTAVAQVVFYLAPFSVSSHWSFSSARRLGRSAAASWQR